MNGTAFLLCPELKKKKKKKKKKKIALPTLPIYRPTGQTDLLFFRPGGGGKEGIIWDLLSLFFIFLTVRGNM